MAKRLHNLFSDLGYSEENGLYILHKSINEIRANFPHRISRILTDIIQPYAIYCHDSNFNESEHVKPFNIPLILFYDSPAENEYGQIAKHSFNLSRSPIVIINNETSQTIDIFHGFSFSSSNSEWLKKIDIDFDLLSIDNLRNGSGWRSIYQNHFSKSKTVDRYLLSNITDARRILVAREDNFEAGNLIPEIANRLIGRLIFVRYLIDRNVSFTDQKLLSGETKSDRQESFNSLLLDHNKLYDFFEYITSKFKGDLFPLEFDNYGELLKERDHVKPENLKILYYLLTCSNIFTGRDIKGYSVQPSLFNKYDFEIIPVELISNIYESFLGSTAHAKSENVVVKLSKQKQVKAYYTPPFLVDYVLSQTVNPFLKNVNKPTCKVLDPSCGSGIFLVESLRQIIEKDIEIETVSDENYQISNERLWNLLQNNIYGIDIDSNAIEITTFSLYITLLDYKKFPKQIEDFEFKSLIGLNLFGGIRADFFNEENEFNKKFKSELQLDFIIGNPPWGHVSSSRYTEYLELRSERERTDNRELGIKLEIGNKEISQAFILRVEDLIQSQSNTVVCFIVTGKNLYNSDDKAVEWRKYFLTKNRVIQCFDLIGVNNKIAGGKKVFDNADQPPAILMYDLKRQLIPTNSVKHIAARANKYFNYFKTIVIEKNDVKYIDQNLFIKMDKLWKVLLYGNSLDYQFIKRLLSPKYDKCNEIIDRENLTVTGGFKSTDKSIPVEKRKDTSKLWDYAYLEVSRRQKDLRPYFVNSRQTFKEKLEQLYQVGGIHSDLKVPQISSNETFSGKKLLIKKGLDADLDHRTVSAFTEIDCVFSATIASVTSKSGDMDSKTESILYAMSAIFNSRLFTYYLLMTSSSFGAGRNRANFDEFLEAPFYFSDELSSLSKEMHSLVSRPRIETKNEIENIESRIENEIFRVFQITSVEKSLIDYALKISLPVYKRLNQKGSTSTHLVFSNVNKRNESVLREYVMVFKDHFGKRFNSKTSSFNLDVYVNKEFIGVNFSIGNKRKNEIQIIHNSEISDFVTKLGQLGIHEVSSKLYAQQDIRGFNKNSFYIIKPNEVKNWHKALAYLDLNEFIEAIAKAELKHIQNI